MYQGSIKVLHHYNNYILKLYVTVLNYKILNSDDNNDRYNELVMSWYCSQLWYCA